VPRQEDLLISAVLRGAGVRSAIKLGVTRDLFLRRRPEWMYLERHPGVGRAVFKGQFPDFRVLIAEPDELETIVEQTRAARLDYELGQVFTKYQRMYGNQQSDALIAKMMGDLTGLVTAYTRGQDVNVFEDWHGAYQDVRQRKLAEESGQIIGYPFGVPTLDEELGGIQAPDLVTVVARQGEFKTWMSLYFCTQVLLAGGKAMYVSLEMDLPQLRFRIHTLMSRLLAASHKARFKTIFSNTGLMRGSVDLKEYRLFLRRAKRHVAKGLVIPEAKDAGSIHQFRAKVDQHGPDVAFYDYFGLAIGDNKVENWVEAANMSRGFKQICTDYKIPIILNAQANRSAADAKDAPRLDQIAYTDNLGRDSDRVFSMRLRRGELSLHVAKNRFGPQGQTIHFDLDIDKGVIDEIVRGKLHGHDEE
jgi:replicative DNA helicase